MGLKMETKNYDKMRWQLCEKCCKEENSTAVYESGEYCGGNGDIISITVDRIIKSGIDNGERWSNPVVRVRADQPMCATNYSLCKVCPYELEHWIFYDANEKLKK